MTVQKFDEDAFLFDPRFDATKPFTIRFDGHKFSALKGLDKPFDAMFTAGMVEAAKAVMVKMGADLAFVGSDEITIGVLPKPSVEPPYANRVSKITTIGATTCSSTFSEMMKEHTNRHLHGRIAFDAKSFVFDTTEQMIEQFEDRMASVRRNAVSMIAHKMFGHKAILNKNTRQKIEMIGHQYELYDRFDTHGTFLIRETRLVYPSEMTDVPEQFRPTEPVVRSHIVTKQMNHESLVSYTDGVLGKYQLKDTHEKL